ncbi:OsmC family protein [Chloroflexi bacterium TSY]|nr:OsmC family protein [Chloroflexi bacterium TSY]
MASFCPLAFIVQSGGDHDAPNPGDILCAAVAACLDSTIRIMAEHLRVTLTMLEVTVMAQVDVRGTLLVEKSVPVGFQSMQCHVKLEPIEGTNPALVQKLVGMSERCCVNLQTMIGDIAVETKGP